MTEAEHALTAAEEAKDRIEQMRVELMGHLARLRQATDEFVRELAAPAH